MTTAGKRTFTGFLATALIAMLLAGCGGGSGNRTAGKHNDTIRMSTTTVYSSIDPHYVAQNADLVLSSLLYEGFYDVDDLGNLTPRLATGYDISADGLVYTYHLKSGVKWQTGEDFSSADVLYSIARAQESPYTYDYVAYIADAAAPDNVTVVITLIGISPTFHIDINRVWFLSEAASKNLDYGFTNELPGGTGPYTLSSWRPDSKVVVTRNPSYHGDPAPIGTIEITVFGDSNAALRAFEAGELDYTSTGVPPADWERIVDSAKYKTVVQDTISVVFVSMNNQVAPFDDIRVRQAFNYAINKDDIIIAAAEGFGTPASVLGNSNLVFGVPKPGEIFEYGYNPERARQLLAEAGYPNGMTLAAPILTMATDEFSIPTQVVQNQLARVGVNVEIRISEQSALVEDLILGNYSLAMMGLSLSVDASMITLAYKTDYIDALNLARYSNPRVDDLFEQAGSIMNREERIRLYREAFDIASREAAYVPLYSMQAGFAMDPDLDASVYTNWYYWYWN